MKIYDFRSDTITRPTDAMRDAMRSADVGDDVCEEDPTVNRLQKIAAKKLGVEATLFVPSGVFSNQCAIGLHTSPGQEIILNENSHVVQHETGAAGCMWGAQMRPLIPQEANYLQVNDIEPRIRKGNDVHIPRTGLILLENALSDGTVMPIEEIKQIKDLAGKHGIPIHLDGARIFNAALALGISPKEIAAQADTITFCLSKGLGAPVGSLLCGTTSFISRARKRRKMMGGGMRQVGVLAAPGIIALENGPAHLETDHANATLLAELLSNIPGVVVDTKSVQTNMVFCSLDHERRSEDSLVKYLASRNMKTFPPFDNKIRFVTSYEVTREDVYLLAETIAEYLAKG
jgi:threonine aldolase